MEKVDFNEVAIANRIALIRQAYEDLIPVKDRLEDVARISQDRPDYFTAIPSCMAFTAQYSKTTWSVVRLFQDAQDSLDAVLDVYRETVATMYAANEAIAADFAAITNLQLDPDQRARRTGGYLEDGYYIT